MKMNEEVILKTENVTVRVLSLAAEKAPLGTFTTKSLITCFCLSGDILVLLRNPDEEVRLQIGQRCEVYPLRMHQVANMGAKEAKYLLVQGVGQYDFNIVGS